jgi:hypothetical protein
MFVYLSAFQRFGVIGLIACVLAAIVVVPARAAITSATLSANPASYTGTCPVTINFSGTIVGTPGTFTFFIVRNGVSSAAMVGMIPNSGTLAVSDNIIVSATGSGYDQIRVPSPHIGEVLSPQAAYSVTCTAATPAPSPSSQLRIAPAHLAPCPTCVIRTYTLYPSQTATYAYHSGGGVNFAPGCSLPHYLRTQNIPHPSGATWIGFQDSYSRAGCAWGDETEFWKFDTFLRFDFSGHPITHLYSARLKAHVLGRYPATDSFAISSCVSAVRLLTTAWPTGNDNGLLTGDPRPQGMVVTTDPSAVFVTGSALDADVSKAFRPLPFVPPGSGGPLLVPTNLWVDDPHGWSNPHANDWCLAYFSGWRLEISADQ